jgi:hypothetical protein
MANRMCDYDARCLTGLNDRLVHVRPLIETSFGLHQMIDALEAAVRPETYRVIVNP